MVKARIHSLCLPWVTSFHPGVQGVVRADAAAEPDVQLPQLELVAAAAGRQVGRLAGTGDGCCGGGGGGGGAVVVEV